MKVHTRLITPLIVVGGLSLGMAPSRVFAQTLPARELVAQLRAGGDVLVIRHAHSPRELPTKASANPDNTALERQLDEAGRSGATAMGKAFRELMIPIGDVLASPTYRTLETVRLAGFGTPMRVPELGEGPKGMQGVTEAQAAWLRRRVTQVPPKGNTIIVTHNPNLSGAFPDWGSTVSEGETVVVRPDGNGGMRVVGRIKMEEWPALLAAAHADAAPRLALGAYQVKPGDSIVIHATGFTPKTMVVSHLMRPDGTEYPSMSFQADARGEFSHTIVIVPPLTGTYVLQMSEASSKAGATTRFMMTAAGTPPPVTSRGDEMTPAYAAVWQGMAAQGSGGEASDLLVTLAGGRLGAVIGTIAYPSCLCGGQLWLLGVYSDSIQLGEMITYGEERCGGRGIITVRPVPDGSLGFAWRDALNPSPGTVTGSLTRQP